MSKVDLPFPASVLDALWSAHPEGTPFPDSSAHLIATSFQSSVKTLPALGVDVTAAVEDKRIIHLMTDPYKSHRGADSLVPRRAQTRI